MCATIFVVAKSFVNKTKRKHTIFCYRSVCKRTKKKLTEAAAMQMTFVLRKEVIFVAAALTFKNMQIILMN